MQGLTGGCLCGALRYSASAEPFMTEYCHCGMCTRSAGAFAVCWMDFKAEEVSWTQGQPKEFESSATMWRGFCAACGSTISFRSTKYPQYYTLSMATLDDPNRVKPARHIHVQDKVPWLDIYDDCRRFPQGPTRD